jgi:leucyl aminopeptidase
MEIRSTNVSPLEIDADAIVVGVLSDRPLSGYAAQVDAASDGLLKRLVDRQELSAKPYDLTLLHSASGIKSPLVAVVGLGAGDKFDRATLFRAASAASRALAAKARSHVAFYLDDLGQASLVEQGVAGAAVGCQGQDLYREKKARFEPTTISWASTNSAAIEAGRTLGEGINLTRRLVNEPPQEIYPESFVARAVEVAKQTGLTCEVWDQAKLEAERCGSLLAVAKGSVRPPQLVILEHRGGPAGGAPLALVGKGVTFDSGGLSLKPSDGMLTMKCDMAGAATVLGAMQTIARLKLPVNVIGLCGLVENMPSGTAMKLGDVLRARSGRTIEVQNTDAEGRLVLADVLNVALDRKPARIVDLATLTGACVVALGTDVAGLMSNDQPWCDTVGRVSRELGEPTWQLPMFADHRLTDYRELINCPIADIRNVGEGRWGGAITAAKFLEEFVGTTPWVHMDIAGPAFFDKPKSWLDGGGSGMFVRTLVELARGHKA